MHDLRAVLQHFRLAERQGTQGLREKAQRPDLHGHLAGPRAEQLPFDADPVAEVEQFDERRVPLRQLLLLEVDLQPARPVTEVGEGAAAHVAHREQAPRHADALRFRLVGEAGQRRGELVGRIERVGVGLDARSRAVSRASRSGRGSASADPRTRTTRGSGARRAGPARNRSRLGSSLAAQIAFDERVEVAVEHAARVADLHVRCDDP